jgi:hypothetical protein
MVAAIHRPPNAPREALIVAAAARLFPLRAPEIAATPAYSAPAQANLWAEGPFCSRSGVTGGKSRASYPAVEKRETRRTGAVWTPAPGLVIAAGNPVHPDRLALRRGVRDALGDACHEAGRRWLLAAGIEEPELVDASHPAAPQRPPPLFRQREVRDEAGCVLVAGEPEAAHTERVARDSALWKGRGLLRRESRVRGCGFSGDRGAVMCRREDGAVVGTREGDPFTYMTRCGWRLCPDCGPLAQRRRAMALEPLLAEEKHLVLGTLSVKADPSMTYAECHERVEAGWQGLRKDPAWAELWRAGIVSTEATWSSPMSRGMKARKYEAQAERLERRAGRLWARPSPLERGHADDEWVSGLDDFDGACADFDDEDGAWEPRHDVAHDRVQRLLTKAADLRRQAEALVWDLSMCRAGERDGYEGSWCNSWRAAEPCTHRHTRELGAYDVRCVDCGAQRKLSSHWHVHMHFANAPRERPRSKEEALELRERSRACWSAALDLGADECNVHLEKPRNALSEVVKYVVKGLDISMMPRERLYELVTHLEGRRLLRVFGEWYGRRDFSEVVKEHETPEADDRSLTHDVDAVVGYALRADGVRVPVRRWEVEIRDDDEARALALTHRALLWEARRAALEDPPPPRVEEGATGPPLPPLARLIIGAEREPGCDDDERAAARPSRRVFKLPETKAHALRRLLAGDGVLAVARTTCGPVNITRADGWAKPVEDVAPLSAFDEWSGFEKPAKREAVVTAEHLRVAADAEHARIVNRNRIKREAVRLRSRNPFVNRLLDNVGRFLRNITDAEADALVERGVAFEKEVTQ